MHFFIFELRKAGEDDLYLLVAANGMTCTVPARASRLGSSKQHNRQMLKKERSRAAEHAADSLTQQGTLRCKSQLTHAAQQPVGPQ